MTEAAAVERWATKLWGADAPLTKIHIAFAKHECPTCGAPLTPGRFRRCAGGQLHLVVRGDGVSPAHASTRTLYQQLRAAYFRLLMDLATRGAKANSDVLDRIERLLAWQQSQEA